MATDNEPTSPPDPPTPPGTPTSGDDGGPTDGSTPAAAPDRPPPPTTDTRDRPPPPTPPAGTDDGTNPRTDGRTQARTPHRTPDRTQARTADRTDPRTPDRTDDHTVPRTDVADTHADAPTARGFARQGSNRTGLVLASVVAGLVLVALVAVVLARDPVQLDLATPEGTVQAWLQSVVDGDPRTDLLDPTVDCEAPAARGDEDRVRAVVLDSTTDGDTATVELSITETYGSGPLDEGWTHEDSYELRRDGDSWLITAYDWPRSSGGDFCWNDRMGLGS